MPPVYAVIVGILTEKFRVPAELISPQSTLEELEMDSLALAEFALVLREETGIELEERDAGTSSSLAELVDRLQARADAGGSDAA
ncbi:acyl carrier protein [Streptomyces ziwulingensis]|uniref:Carrier domain-containing protein n=1 Tax=Streptomyces ziwulingensis TaxID=1045501 RepID=A0ABP9CRD8_9ACTN